MYSRPATLSSKNRLFVTGFGSVEGLAIPADLSLTPFVTRLGNYRVASLQTCRAAYWNVSGLPAVIGFRGRAGHNPESITRCACSAASPIVTTGVQCGGPTGLSFLTSQKRASRCGSAVEARVRRKSRHTKARRGARASAASVLKPRYCTAAKTTPSGETATRSM